jgi:hypothetical protein
VERSKYFGCKIVTNRSVKEEITERIRMQDSFTNPEMSIEGKTKKRWKKKQRNSSESKVKHIG